MNSNLCGCCLPKQRQRLPLWSIEATEVYQNPESQKYEKNAVQSDAELA
jgi:hypothetical protein